MHYLFSFPKHVAQSLNYLLAYGQRFGIMLNENSKIILLFLITIKVLLCSIALIWTTGKFSSIHFNYFLGSSSFFGLVLFISFTALIIAYFYPKLYSIEKDIIYYNKLSNESTDIAEDIDNVISNSDMILNYEFEKLLNKLSELKIYDCKERRFRNKDFDRVTVIQSFQYLLLAFRKTLPLKLEADIDNTSIYEIFNKHFFFSEKSKKMTTQNWNAFKKVRLDDVENNEFYNYLSKELKKATL